MLIHPRQCTHVVSPIQPQEYSTTMTGSDIPQHAIDEYIKRIMAWKDKGGEEEKKPKIINHLGERIQYFRDGEHDIDETGQLYRGLCEEETSVDFGKPRFTYAKSNITAQQEVQKYLFRQFVHEERTGVPNDRKSLVRLKKNKCSSDNGKKLIFRILSGLLRARFDIAPVPFIEGGPKGEWNLPLFFQYADAYVQLYKGTFVHVDFDERGCSCCYSSSLSNLLVILDQPAVSVSDVQQPEDAALVLQGKRHNDLLNLIIDHCDNEFDQTKHVIEAIQDKIQSLERTVDSHHEQLSRRIDDEGVRIDGRIDGLCNRVALLEAELESLKLSQSSGAKVCRDWKEQVSESWRNVIDLFCNDPKSKFNESSVISNVRVKDIWRLNPGEWLNDELVNAFFELLMQHEHKGGCHFFSSYFMTKLLSRDPTSTEDRYEYRNVRKWTKRKGVDLFAHNKVFIPINQGFDHWNLVVIDMQAKKIQLYDSMNKDKPEVLQYLLQYLKDEHMDKKGVPLPDPDDWELVGIQRNQTPRQGNGTHIIYIVSC